MFASGFRYKCRHGLELSIIAGSSRPRFQVPDVQRPSHRCRCSIDERRLWGGYCLSATGSNRPEADVNSGPLLAGSGPSGREAYDPLVPVESAKSANRAYTPARSPPAFNSGKRRYF